MNQLRKLLSFITVILTAVSLRVNATDVVIDPRYYPVAEVIYKWSAPLGETNPLGYYFPAHTSCNNCQHVGVLLDIDVTLTETKSGWTYSVRNPKNNSIGAKNIVLGSPSDIMNWELKVKATSLNEGPRTRAWHTINTNIISIFTGDVIINGIYNEGSRKGYVIVQGEAWSPPTCTVSVPSSVQLPPVSMGELLQLPPGGKVSAGEQVNVKAECTDNATVRLSVKSDNIDGQCLGTNLSGLAICLEGVDMTGGSAVLENNGSGSMIDKTISLTAGRGAGNPASGSGQASLIVTATAE